MEIVESGSEGRIVMKDYVSFECNHFVESDQCDPDERHSIAYADIDGYPTDENEEGTVICRVWLLKEKEGIYPTYIVDWHHNGYRMNKEVLGLIESAKKELKQYKKDLIENLARKAYERYKIQWMLDKGITLPVFIDVLDKKIRDKCNGMGLKEAFEQLQDDIGFIGGDTWEGFECFKVSEFENEEYMRHLLTNEQYALWKCRK